ncbi:helix-turn-helix domain-containing protein [Nocardioides humi]|nr:helix-turn-helix transcriptional regulator [Nocardioides humi]
MAKDRGWTLTETAKAAGISYSKLTQGMSANRWFLEDEVASLAAALEVSVDELMGESLFKATARGSKFDKPRPRTVGEDVGTGRGRALCCECGTFRRFTVAEEVYDGKHVMDVSDDPLGRRMLTTVPCRNCGKDTTHAVLRTDKHRDVAEEWMAEPTREQQAVADRDRLIRRIAEFGVDVHFRTRRPKDRSRGFLMKYEFDESKDRWRIEIDPNAPGRVQHLALVDAWHRIATDQHGDDVDWDPRDGVVSTGKGALWSVAVEELVVDIRRALPMEGQKMRLTAIDGMARAEEKAQ